MLESEPSNHHWDEETKQAFLARILDGFGLPAEPTAPTNIEAFAAEAVGSPGRGMEDDMSSGIDVTIDEKLYDRVASVAEVIDEDPEEFVERAILERLHHFPGIQRMILAANTEHHQGRVGCVEGVFIFPDAPDTD